MISLWYILNPTSCHLNSSCACGFSPPFAFQQPQKFPNEKLREQALKVLAYFSTCLVKDFSLPRSRHFQSSFTISFFFQPNSALKNFVSRHLLKLFVYIAVSGHRLQWIRIEGILCNYQLPLSLRVDKNVINHCNIVRC